MTTPIIFLSYSRKNLSDTKFIAGTIMAHGLQVWQDIENLGGGLTEAQVREIISGNLDGLLYFITQESINSTFICEIELPEAENRYRNNKNFQIVPIFDIPIENAVAALKPYTSVPISNFNGAILKNKFSNRELNIVKAASKAAEIILMSLDLSSNDTIFIGVSSKQKVMEKVNLNFDYMNYFKSGYPDVNTWNKIFLPAINSVKNIIIDKNIRKIKFSAYAHLTFGYLFGFVFSRIAGFQISIEQRTNTESAIWSSENGPSDHNLKIVELSGDIESDVVCIKINLMSLDNESVNRYAENANLSFRVTLEYIPPDYPYMITEGEAIKIGIEIAQEIKRMHAKYGTIKTHIFAAIPFGLSLFIGYNLNAVGTVQCYEFDNAVREYIPSCTIF